MRAKRRRAGRPGLILAVVALAAAAPSGAAERTADPARIVTWDSPAVSQSHFVDPSAAPDGYYAEPPGVDPRPNALKLDVYLPAGYSTHPARRYPVLWLLHGHGDAYDSWPNAGNGDLLNTASGFGSIIVMPEGDHGWYANWWNGGARGGPAWERYHLDQLLPYVTHRLRIRHGRRWHAIAGLSMGGEGAAYYATQRPGYFGSAASFSGVLSMERPEWPTAFNTQGEDFDTVFGGAGSFYVAGHDPTTLVDNLQATRLFVSVGDGVPDPTIPSEVTNYFGAAAEAELRQHATDFVAAAQAAGEDVTYTPHQGIHTWHYWKEDLQNAIGWDLFGRPPAAHHTWTYSTVATVGRMWDIGFRFAKPPTTVETFTRNGSTLSGEGSGKVTLRLPGGCRIKPKLPFSDAVVPC